MITCFRAEAPSSSSDRINKLTLIEIIYRDKYFFSRNINPLETAYQRTLSCLLFNPRFWITHRWTTSYNFLNPTLTAFGGVCNNPERRETTTKTTTTNGKQLESIFNVGVNKQTSGGKRSGQLSDSSTCRFLFLLQHSSSSCSSPSSQHS